MFVGDDVLMVFLRYEGQQTLGIHGRCFRFAQVEYVQSFFEEGGDNLVLFYEKRRRGDYDEFHVFCYNLDSIRDKIKKYLLLYGRFSLKICYEE